MIAPRINYIRLRDTFSGGMAKRWGQPCIIRSSTPGVADRYSYLVTPRDNPLERIGQVANPTDISGILSTVDWDGNPLDTPTETDRIITYQTDQATGETLDPLQEKETFHITARPENVDNGAIVIYWKLKLRK